MVSAGLEIKEERKIKSQNKLCEVCERYFATRRMLTYLNGEPFELYCLCDDEKCLADLKKTL